MRQEPLAETAPSGKVALVRDATDSAAMIEVVPQPHAGNHSPALLHAATGYSREVCASRWWRSIITLPLLLATALAPLPLAAEDAVEADVVSGRVGIIDGEVWCREFIVKPPYADHVYQSVASLNGDVIIRIKKNIRTGDRETEYSKTYVSFLSGGGVDESEIKKDDDKSGLIAFFRNPLYIGGREIVFLPAASACLKNTFYSLGGTRGRSIVAKTVEENVKVFCERDDYTKDDPTYDEYAVVSRLSSAHSCAVLNDNIVCTISVPGKIYAMRLDENLALRCPLDFPVRLVSAKALRDIDRSIPGSNTRTQSDVQRAFDSVYDLIFGEKGE